MAIESPAGGTVLSGYAQLQAEWVGVGPDPRYTGEANVRRIVLAAAHDFSRLGPPIRAYAEFEWENAVTSAGGPGSAEVEQAYLEARVAGDALSLRAGLVLVPFGIVNEWHEPPVFHGVDRPTLDQVLIPTTWRELGVGITGRPGVLRYQLYAMTSLDPTGFGTTGILGGVTLGARARVDAVAVAGRAEVEPVLGLVAGASFYATDAGGNGDFYDAYGERRGLHVPVLGADVDVRWKGYGVEARALGVGFWLPESDDLQTALRADGSPWFAAGVGALPTHMRGGYVELGWNVLYPTDSTMELVPFARLEHYDTQAEVVEGLEADPRRTVDEGTFGLSYRPISNVVVKADVQLRDRRYGDDELQVNVGTGWMF